MLLPAVTAAAAELPDNLDPRWSGWLGCWELYSQSVNRVELEIPEKQLACVVPLAEDIGVKVMIDDAGKPKAVDGYLADGREVPNKSTPGCSGWQRSHWSSDSERLYVRSELSCERGPDRRSTAVSLLTADHSWVEIRRMEFGGGSQVSVRRFVPTLRQNARVPTQPPFMPASALSLDDVIEAHGALDPEVVENLLLECGYQGQVEGRDLIRLADAGVDSGVIDLVVALSFPERFEIQGRAVFERIEPPSGMTMSTSYVSVWPWWGDHYDPYWWYWYPVHPYPPPPPDGPSAAQPARVIKGKGYTRARVVPAGGEGGSLGKAVSKVVSGSADGGSTDAGSRSGDSGTASDSGYSGSSSTGRTAVPRSKQDR
jgi:hypothetical protein